MLSPDIHPTHSKAQLSFNNGILFVKFYDQVVVEVEDVIYIYCYALEQSNRKPFGLLFDSSGNHEFSEEAIVYFSENTMQRNILAIAYVSETLLSKIRFNLFLIFEKPPFKPSFFSNETDARLWLEQQLRHP